MLIIAMDGGTVSFGVQQKTPPNKQLSLLSDGGATSEESPYTVLIADDDDGLRETIRYWLTEQSDQWEVREASDGEEALEKIDDSVDILLLDRRMPELSGPEVLDRLDETDFDGKVVVVSAYESDEYLNENDVAEYIIKPIFQEEFVNQLQQSL